MKQSKLFLIAITLGAMAASSAIARPATVRTQATSRSFSAARPSSTHWAHNNNNWSHRHHRHHRHSRVYFAFGYPFGYGYPYYGYYPYRYGYYTGPREVTYEAATVDRSIVINVQRRLARNGYYHGAIDGVIGLGTHNAIRSYERAHGLRIDGQIDQRLLATLGLA
jgi:hypothetical protein